jgi:hypothetical protein
MAGERHDEAQADQGVERGAARVGDSAHVQAEASNSLTNPDSTAAYSAMKGGHDATTAKTLDGKNPFTVVDADGHAVTAHAADSKQGGSVERTTATKVDNWDNKGVATHGVDRTPTQSSTETIQIPGSGATVQAEKGADAAVLSRNAALNGDVGALNALAGGDANKMKSLGANDASISAATGLNSADAKYVGLASASAPDAHTLGLGTDTANLINAMPGSKLTPADQLANSIIGQGVDKLGDAMTYAWKPMSKEDQAYYNQKQAEENTNTAQAERVQAEYQANLATQSRMAAEQQADYQTKLAEYAKQEAEKRQSA